MRILLAAVVTLFALGSVQAEAVNEERETVEKVNRAIDRGVQYLRSTYDPKTQWENKWVDSMSDLRGGSTALAVLALLNCGVKPTEKDVAGALDFLRKTERKKTYVVGLITMALYEARNERDLPIIQENVDWLLKNSVHDAAGEILGWSYPAEGAEPDGSNTQYALLGLYAGKQAGAKIDNEEWKRIRRTYIKTMKAEGKDSGFWTYYVKSKREGERQGSFSMTVAGACGLVITRMGLDESGQQLDTTTGVAAKCGQYEGDEQLRRSLNYIGHDDHFHLFKPRGYLMASYNLYGIERIGRLSGQRFLGRYDWYRDGCDKLVAMQDAAKGSWVIPGDGPGAGLDNYPGLVTSFALLFLSKGRTPVLISKLAYGDHQFDNGVLRERGGNGEIIDWNRKHDDARHLTEYASRELFKGMPLGWQVYDPRRREFLKQEEILSEVGVLVQSPLLYITGHNAPKLKGQHKEILKRYIEEGGFILAESCCGSEEFATGFKDLMRELFPDSKLAPMSPEHAIWRTYFPVPPTEFRKLECLDRGCRTVVVFSPEPLAGYWEETKYMNVAKREFPTRGENAYRLAGNIIAYATGMEPPQQRLATKKIIDVSKADLSPPRGFVKPAQLKFAGESHPAPAAMRNLMTHLRSTAKVDVVPERESISPADDELFKFRFVYAHGRKRFSLANDEVENLRAHLQSGGLLFADACCGKEEFDSSFREMTLKLFPDRKLERIPADDELYSAKLNGKAITSVKRREKTDATGPDGGFRELPPHLEGIKIDGRWAIIYSKYDIGCSMEGHKSTDCLGHTRESALQLATAAMMYVLKR